MSLPLAPPPRSATATPLPPSFTKSFSSHLASQHTSQPTSQPPLQTPIQDLPPSTFDILPPLHELLSRLLPTPPGTLPTTHSSPYPNTNAPPLDIQNLAAEVSAVRARIRRARQVVESLPDGERGVGEQEEEIEELRRRVGGLEGVLRDIAGGAVGGG